MKRFGFTLSELLISIAIIGVIAAFVAPAVSDLMPDKNKSKVLKYNAVINNFLIDTFNDPSQYNPNNGEGIVTVANFEAKLRTALEIDASTNKSPDGSLWTITQDVTTGTYSLVVDVEPNNSTSVQYSANDKDPKDIDTFVLNIDKFGNVDAGDPLTQAYLRNSKKMNDKKNDFVSAEKILIAQTTKTEGSVGSSGSGEGNSNSGESSEGTDGNDDTGEGSEGADGNDGNDDTGEGSDGSDDSDSKPDLIVNPDGLVPVLREDLTPVE